MTEAQDLHLTTNFESFDTRRGVEMHRVVNICRKPWPLFTTLLTFLTQFQEQSFTLSAQELVRNSLAGEQAAENRHQAGTGHDYYNFKLGPTAWTVSAGLGLEFSDNIRLEHSDPQADLIFRPELGSRMNFPVSDKNSIHFGLIAGYSAYLSHSEYDRWYVNPGSELSWDMYVGDFWLNVHDRLSILEDSYQDPTVVGIADYSQLQNAAGVSALWDLNKLSLQTTYEHLNYSTLRGNGQLNSRQPDGSSEVLTASAGLRLKPELLTGIEASGSFIRYDQTAASGFYTDGTQVKIGCFSEVKLSQYISARGSIGYTVFSPDTSTSGQEMQDFSGIYATISLTHNFNPFLEYELSGGRNLTFNLYGGTFDLASARCTANWKLFRKTRFSTSFDFEHGAQVGIGREVFDRYGPGLKLARDITQQLSAEIIYQFYYRDSDLPERDYSLNIAVLEFNYRF